MPDRDGDNLANAMHLAGGRNKCQIRDKPRPNADRLDFHERVPILTFNLEDYSFWEKKNGASVSLGSNSFPQFERWTLLNVARTFFDENPPV